MSYNFSSTLCDNVVNFFREVIILYNHRSNVIYWRARTSNTKHDILYTDKLNLTQKAHKTVYEGSEQSSELPRHMCTHNCEVIGEVVCPSCLESNARKR